MSHQLKNVVVIGASGNLGKPIVHALLEAGTFNVSALTRVESKSTFPSKVKHLTSDFTEASLFEALKGQDAVISALGGAAIHEQTKVIDAAIKAGVKRYIPSEFGSNTANPKTREDVFFFQSKWDIHQYLQKKAAEHKDFSYTTIATGPFFDFCLKVNFVGFNLKEHTAVIWDEGTERFSTSTLPFVGRAVAAVLSHPEKTANKYIYVRGFTTNGNEILAGLEKITGKTWAKSHTSSQKELKEGQELLKKGEIMPGIGKMICANVYGKGYGGDFDKDAVVFNKEIGLPDEDLEESLRAVLAEVNA